MNVTIITTQSWREYSFLPNAWGTLAMAEEVQLCRELNLRNPHTRIYRTSKNFRNTTKFYLSDLLNLFVPTCVLSTKSSEGKKSHYTHRDRYAHTYTHLINLSMYHLIHFTDHFRKAKEFFQMLLKLKSHTCSSPPPSCPLSPKSPSHSWLSLKQMMPAVCKLWEFRATAMIQGKPLSWQIIHFQIWWDYPQVAHLYSCNLAINS